jgi:hypothetical protein
VDRFVLVVPATVVEDSDELVALYVAMDTPAKVALRNDGSRIPRSLPYAEREAIPWRLGDGAWFGSSVLWITRPGERFALGCFWEGEERQFAGYYLNLQASLVRHDLGFDTEDHVLDVQFWPDSSWNWKDEDEFAEAIQLGRFTLDEANDIRETALAVIDAWNARAWPFDRDWSAWQPDDGWEIPAFPANWDTRSSPFRS